MTGQLRRRKTFERKRVDGFYKNTREMVIVIIKQKME